jgi:hypothetical protein
MYYVLADQNTQAVQANVLALKWLFWSSTVLPAGVKETPFDSLLQVVLLGPDWCSDRMCLVVGVRPWWLPSSFLAASQQVHSSCQSGTRWLHLKGVNMGFLELLRLS